jgi:hypothetical protein
MHCITQTRNAVSPFVASSQDKDDEDEDLEHGKAHDDMWTLDLKTHTVSDTLRCTLTLLACAICNCMIARRPKSLITKSAPIL